MRILFYLFKIFLSISSIELCHSNEIALSEDMLKFYIEQKIEFPENTILTNLKFINTNSQIKVENISYLDFKCADCNSLGLKNIQIKNLNASEPSKQISWIQVKVEKKIMALKAKVDILGPAQIVDVKNFEPSELITDHPENFVLDVNTLHFYKSNKAISKNSFLRISDLVPQNLVTPGKPLSVLIESNGLTLRFPALSKERGTIGQTISVKNEKNGKTLIGEVSDFNIVRVRL